MTAGGVARCDWDENWDRKGSNSKNNSDSGLGDSVRCVHRIILVRHGQYCQGSTDEERKLTEKGRQQAVDTGKRLQVLLKETNEYPGVRHVYYSTMARATETAQLMLPYIKGDSTKVEPCSMIREGACYRPVPPISRERWPVNDEDFYVDGKRIEAAFTAHVHRPDAVDTDGSSYTTVLVCHGNVIRYFVARALQLDPEIWLRMAVNNASYTVLDVHSDGHVSLRALGNDGHLSADMITYM